MAKQKQSIDYKNSIMEFLMKSEKNKDLYIFIKLSRMINEEVKNKLNLNEEEIDILSNINEEVKFKIEINKENNQIYGVIDNNENFIRLVKLINSKFKDMKDKGLISNDSQKNKLITTIDELRKRYGEDLNKLKDEDKFEISISNIVSLELVNNRVFNAKQIRGTITSPVYSDIYMYKEDYKEFTNQYVEDIFENETYLTCEEVVNKLFDIFLFKKKKLSVNNNGDNKLNFLLKGVPGTGKSTLIDKYLPKIGVLDMENICKINIHSATSNSDLMQGIGVRLEGEEILYTEKQGIVLNFILRAIKNPDQNYALILEEIQENSLNDILGDLIYLIEERKRVNKSLIIEIKNQLRGINSKTIDSFEIIDKLLEKYRGIYYISMPKLAEDNVTNRFNKLVIPNNLFIFCTTNYREEKKIIEDNLFRRFEVIDIFPDSEVIEDKYIKIFFESLNKSIEEKYKEFIHTDRYLIGHANWMFINNQKEFYSEFIKLINDFKEIKEITFEEFKEIILSIKLNNEWNDNENIYKESFNEIIEYLNDDKSNYYEIIRKLIKEVNYELLEGNRDE